MQWKQAAKTKKSPSKRILVMQWKQAASIRYARWPFTMIASTFQLVGCLIQLQDLVTEPHHIYIESASYPRLEIPQNLPRQTKANTSPATLYLFGATHTVALDGTPDGKLYH